MDKTIYDKYAMVLFMENLSDDEIKELDNAYKYGGYISEGPLFTQGYKSEGV